MFLKISFFIFIGCMWQHCDAFEGNKYSYENNSFHSNASFVSINKTEPLLLNILVVSNDSSLRQDNYSLMLNNTADNLADSRFEFQLHNSSKYVKSSNLAEHFSEAISTKLAGLFREWMKSFLSLKISVHKNRYNGKSESTSINIVSSGPSFVDLESSEASGDTATTANSENESKKTPAQGRQFLLHPYLPYGKEIKPDEKISIHDVLPIKIVKFVKSMVEDAPWEQMFMKMVRMVVDQFVDKIIEQMFAHKDADEDKWRSFDGGDKSPWLLLKDKMASLKRSRRSSGKNKFEKEMTSSGNPSMSHKSEKDDSWSSNSFAAINRISKEDSPKTREDPEPTWLDSVLDYLFPEESEKSKSGTNKSRNERKKRDVDYRSPTKNLRMEDILKTFLKKYIEFSGEESIAGNSIDVAQDDVDEESSTEQPELEDLNESSTEQTQLEDLNESSTEQPELEDLNEYSTEQPELEDLNETFDTSETVPPHWSELNPRFDTARHLMRRKRSSDSDSQKESKRLWQANLKGRPLSHRSARDECGLRRACNAGRLLARLPSVPDLTLQLKEYGNEPHWDALLWGMSKKRCSKIFCKRERSPKGSKHYWNNPEKRFYRKHSPASRLRDSKSDLTTIFPI